MTQPATLADKTVLLADWQRLIDERDTLAVRNAALEETVAIWAAEGPEDAERRALNNAIDRIGWPEIQAFRAALADGQDVREDAGGYFVRAIRALLGVPVRDPILTYQEAARHLLNGAQRDGAAA